MNWRRAARAELGRKASMEFDGWNFESLYHESLDEAKDCFWTPDLLHLKPGGQSRWHKPSQTPMFFRTGDHGRPGSTIKL